MGEDGALTNHKTNEKRPETKKKGMTIKKSLWTRMGLLQTIKQMRRDLKQKRRERL